MADSTFQAGKLRTYNTRDLMTGKSLREFMLFAGKDGSGKSSLLVAFASYIEAALNPEAQFFVIDLENKFRSAIRSFARDAPENIVYIPCADMNEATEALQMVLVQRRPDDWLAVESAARLWERSQDLGYQAITGTSKPAYMERRRAFGKENPHAKAPPVTPSPDDLWSIVKGAHDGAFIDILTALTDLNVIITTTIGRPPKERANRQENTDRKELRAEFGIDANLEGAPRLPYYAETLCLLGLKNGHGQCRVVRDNLSVLPEPRVEFEVRNRKDWGADFWSNCR